MESVGKFIDITGFTFGKFRVIERVSKSLLKPGEGRAMWLVECECGNIRTKPSTELIKGRAKMCNECRITKKTIRKQEVEKRLNKFNLQLIYYPGKTREKIKFKCFCGNIHEARASAIFNEQVKSCGCVSHKQGEGSIGWKGYGEIDGQYYTHIKTTAIVRGFSLDVSIEQLWDLFLKQNRRCAITGLEIKFKFGTKENKNRTASLDRIDSSKGYTIDNVQWVHKKINIMKGNMKDEELVMWARLITDYSKENGKWRV